MCHCELQQVEDGAVSFLFRVASTWSDATVDQLALFHKEAHLDSNFFDSDDEDKLLSTSELATKFSV